MRSPAVENFENRLRFDEVTESVKVGTFLRHSVVVICWVFCTVTTNHTVSQNQLYAQCKGPNVTNPICWTCKNGSYKCADERVSECVGFNVPLDTLYVISGTIFTGQMT